MASPSEKIEALSGVPVQWAGLSPHLIAKIFPCDSDGIALKDSPLVLGPITDTNFDMTLGWQSPFENTGPESKIPSLMALIQSGQLSTVVNAIQANGGIDKDGFIGKKLNAAADSLKAASKDLQGKTGITKLNSRVVFTGMPPIKISLTLHFRAYKDPQEEVMKPYEQLLKWALPQKLAPDGALVNGLENKSLLSALFPSDAPQMVGFHYANNKYSPMVIEYIAHPIDGPLCTDGLPLHRAIKVTLSTLTALDKNDVQKIFAR